jgi:bifunctional non-homologous end joining protein LigD
MGPMLATTAAELPLGDEWSYEVKWDGYRTLAEKDGARVRLLSRNLNDATANYPTVAGALAEVRADSVLLDGEVVAIDESGRPSFQALHHRAAHAIVFYAFDVLHLNGEDLTKRPLDERRKALASVVAGTRLLRSEPLPGTPSQIEAAVRGLNLEGVIAKRRDSLYEPGKRSKRWVKVKFNRRQEFVVGGVKPNGASFESLLVGYYEGKQFLFAAKVRAGLRPHDRSEIVRRLAGSDTQRCPFANLPMGKTSHWGEGITDEDMKTLRWVEPRLVVEVSFVEWPSDGLLRHSEFVAVRDDKDPREVRRDLVTA